MHPLEALFVLRGCVVLQMVFAPTMLRIATAHAYDAPCLVVPRSPLACEWYLSTLGQVDMYQLHPEGYAAIAPRFLAMLECNPLSAEALRDFLTL